MDNISDTVYGKTSVIDWFKANGRKMPEPKPDVPEKRYVTLTPLYRDRDGERCG